MGHLVGSKGQVVIKKEIRDRLGVQPGWRTVQLLVGDHVELYFIPPEHNRSLFSILKPYIKRSFPTEDDLRQAREAAWAARAAEKMAASEPVDDHSQPANVAGAS